MDFKAKLLALTAKDVMSTNLKTLHFSQKTNRAKEIMRLQKIGGLVVMDDNNQVVGIITMENLMIALEKKMMDQPVEKIMKRQVITVSCTDCLKKILHLIQKHNFRRLPVIDKAGKPVGIITSSKIIDIFTNLLEEENDAHDIKKDGEAFVVAFEVESGDFQKLGEASTGVKNVLKDMGGFPASLIRRVGVVAYEGETNIVIHSLGGKLEAKISPTQINLIFSDIGPGIADIKKACQPGFSTASEQVKEMGFGAGMGLYNMEKFADNIAIKSKLGTATIINAEFKVNK